MPRVLSAKVVSFVLLLWVCDICIFPSLFESGFMRPVLTYLIIVYAAFRWDWRKTAGLALFVGLLRDVTGSQPLGVETAVLTSSALVLGFLAQKMERDSFVVRVLAVFLFVFFDSLLILFLSGFLNFTNEFSGFFFLMIVSSAFLTALISPLFFYLTGKWFKDHLPLKQYELFG